MSAARQTASALLLSLLAPMGLADEFDERWSWLIKQDFKAGCVLRMKSQMVTVGTNGNRRALWIVETCEGLFEYGAAYDNSPLLPPGKKRYSVSKPRPVAPVTANHLKQLFSDQ